MARPDKEAVIARLADRFRASDAVLLTEYRGLSVADLKALRRSPGAQAHGRRRRVRSVTAPTPSPPGGARARRPCWAVVDPPTLAI